MPSLSLEAGMKLSFITWLLSTSFRPRGLHVDSVYRRLLHYRPNLSVIWKKVSVKVVSKPSCSVTPSKSASLGKPFVKVLMKRCNFQHFIIYHSNTGTFPVSCHSISLSMHKFNVHTQRKPAILIAYEAVQITLLQ